MFLSNNTKCKICLDKTKNILYNLNTKYINGRNFDMKKLFTLALTVLMLLSCFTVTTSAADGVNVFAAEKGAIYSYDTEVAFYNSCVDDTNTILNDGVVPDAELPGESVGFTGTGVTVMFTIDLGAFYTDITDINFLCVCDSYGDGKSNRGFSGEKTAFKFSTDGLTFERNKDFTMSRVDIDDIETNSFYNFCFKFDAPISARYINITMNNSGGYVLSLGEVEVISASGVGEEPPVVEEPAEEEPSEEEPTEEPSEDVVASEAESEAASEAASEAESEAESEAASEATSEAASEAASTDDNSKDNEDKDGINPIVIVVIVVAVVAVAAVVVVVLKKKK